MISGRRPMKTKHEFKKDILLRTKHDSQRDNLRKKCDNKKDSSQGTEVGGRAEMFCDLVLSFMNLRNSEFCQIQRFAKMK